MGKQEFAIPALAAQLQTEADAYRLLEELRWNGHPSTCPHCGGIGRCYFLRPRDGVSRRTRTGSRSERRVWRCGHCRRSFSVLVGTVLHGTKVPIRIWSLVVVALCASDNGVAAAQIKRDYGLTAKTARFMLRRIRQAMQRDPLALLLGGTVVGEQPRLGGDQHDRDRPNPGRRGRTGKTPAAALADRQADEVVARAVAAVTRRASPDDARVSLAPLDPEQALRALLQVDPAG